MIPGLESDITLSPDEFRTIRDFIHQKSGMYFAENKTYLVKNRLRKRMAELDITSVRDYFYHVKYDVSLNEFNRLVSLLTTNETSFFRNEPQLLSFSDEVLPALMADKEGTGNPRTLRLWSAGCSTGEEPFTLAIILLEKLKNLRDWQIEVIANDISEPVLQAARRGEYASVTLRNVKPDILERYFTQVGDIHRVNPELKALVKFLQLNLSDPRKISLINNVDVIFCRNVMIYFSDEVKRRLARGFFNTLRPGGYLYIGHAESLHSISRAFKLVYFRNALVYRKETVPQPSGVDASGRDVAASGRIVDDNTSSAARALDLLSKIKSVSVRE